MRAFLPVLTLAGLLLTGCGAERSPAAASPTRALMAQARADANAFPAVGKVVRVNFGPRSTFNLHFHSLTRLTYQHVAADGQEDGGETVAIAVTPVAQGVFMVTWQESDGTTVTHVEDYATGVLHTNITTADRQFLNLHGTLKILP